MKRVLVLFMLIAVASGCSLLGDSGPADQKVEQLNESDDVPDEADQEDEQSKDEVNGTEEEMNETNGTTETEVSGKEVKVYYTESGFEPSVKRIDQGDTVTWVNNASQAMWVGSDNHPSHTKYSGTSVYQHCSNGESDTFDQCSEGDSYSFTFEKTGEWGYHNHRSPFDEGTIVVE